MVIDKTDSWASIVQMLKEMLYGDFIDAFIVEFIEPHSGSPKISFYSLSCMKELELVAEVLPSILPPAKGFELQSNEVVKIGPRTFRVAKIILIPIPH